MIRRFLATISLVLTTALSVQAGVLLVEKGQPKAVIVLARNPSDQASEAAKLLQDYLARLSGARLEIQDESAPVTGPQILIGRSERATELGVVVTPRLTHAMNEEEYRLKTVGNALILAGNENPFYRGTVFAVSDLLERLGCRWFFPGKFGEVLPTLDTIEIGPLNVHERPDFRFRNIWYSGWMPVPENAAAEFAVWMDRNRMNSLIRHDHASQQRFLQSPEVRLGEHQVVLKTAHHEIHIDRRV